MERVFVKVVGFSDAERHALNTLFRLSEERETRYLPWTVEHGAAPHLTLIDSESHEAVVEFELPSNQGARVVWIGERTPARAWRSFPRPIDWPAVIAAMDQLFMPAAHDIEGGLDLDFELDLPDPSVLVEGGPRRALIANADRAERLYIRARMALADLTQADEAETAADALELARKHRYDVAVIDYALPGKGGWPLVRALAQIDQRIPLLIVTKDRLTPAEKARMLLGRQPILLEKPVHPLKLTALLSRV